MKILVITGTILVLVAALASTAISRESYGGMDWGKSSGGKHKDIERIDMVKTVTGVSPDGNVTFQIPSVAVTGKDGKVATMTFPTPLQGNFNLPMGAGHVTAQGATAADIAVRPENNATVSLTGGTVVMSMQDVRVLLDDRDYFIAEYSKLGVLMPDGTAKEYRLLQPVKISYSKDRKVMMIDGYRALSDTLGYAFTSTTQFPSGTTVLVKDIEDAQSTGRMRTIGTAPILQPSATATPVASPVISPTPVVTPVVSPTPVVTPVVTPAPTVTPTATPVATPTEIPTVVPTVIPTVTTTPVVSPTVLPTPVTSL